MKTSPMLTLVLGIVTTLGAMSAEGQVVRDSRLPNGPILESPPRTSAADPLRMAESIQTQLAGRTVGYGYALLKNGALVQQGSGGYKRVPILDGGLPFLPTTKVNVMSVSKTVTAVAVLQLMELHSVEPEDPIGDWLPPSWEEGLGFGDGGITFRDLLTHCTGVKQTIEKLDAEDPEFEALSPNTYEGLRALAAHGIYPEFANIGAGDDFSTCSYKNANFNFGRILIWQMAVLGGLYSNNTELAADINSAAIYQAYVRDHVLEPAGVLDGACYSLEPEDQRELYYDANWNIFPLLFSKGRMRGGFNGLLGCGAVNWHLSAVDLVKVLGAIRYGGLLSNQARTWMDELEMGWNGGSVALGKLYHGGLYKSGPTVLALAMPYTPWNPTAMPKYFNVKTAVRMHSCVMKVEEGLDAALVVNSSIRGTSDDACDVLIQAYDDAK